MTRSFPRFASALLASTFLLGAAQSSPALATPACGGWTVIPSPNVSDQNDSVLSGVAGNNPSDVWAVGQFAPDQNPNITLTLTEHFDGSAWTIVPSPNVGTQGNALLHVAVLPGGKAWAVGYRIDEKSFYARSLIEYWDGSAWSVVPHPEPGVSAQLFGVSARARDDVWAVGTFQDPLYALHTFIEHFDGEQWELVPSPNPGDRGNTLYGVVSVAANKAFAVGDQSNAGAPQQPLVLSWDGSRWNPVQAFSHPDGNRRLFSIVAKPAGGALAVGEDETDTATGTTGFAAILRPGFDWITQPVSRSNTDDNHLYGVAAARSGPAWAVGAFLDPASGNFFTLIETQREGDVGWTPVDSPNPNPQGTNQLGGVAVVGGDVWAVGTFDGPNARATLVLHRCQPQ
jgi:hypothetical protein